MFTVTEVHRRFGPSIEVPYRVGLVVPDEAPNVRLVTGLGAGVEIGDRVRLARVKETADGPHLEFAA